LRALALADRPTEIAAATGAANTLVFRDGAIEADNTDAAGFLAALRERAPGAPEGMDALVLGAGGAARGVVYALIAAGAARISVWNRHRKRAEELLHDFSQRRPDAELQVVEPPGMPRADLLVNATSVGMPTSDADSAAEWGEGFKELPLSADVWGDRQIVVDLVYRQDGTPFQREALARGAVCVDGFDVLVHQGAVSFRAWTGLEAPLGAMRRGAKDGKTNRRRFTGSEAGPERAG
jgi:shikimate dehydrogenase